MVLIRDYDAEKKIDRAWYNSSHIFYSECDDIVDGLKVLRITFNNGKTYEYRNVDVNDYLMFLVGGLDGSQGKAFYKYIKGRNYPYTKLPDKNIDELKKNMENVQRKQRLEKQKSNG